MSGVSTAQGPIVGDPERLPPELRARRQRCRVALVSMPFGSVVRPSIQLGTLAPLARCHGFPTVTMHLNLDLAARMGTRSYEPLTDYRAAVGDWLFSAEAFGADAPDVAGDPAFLDRFAEELVLAGDGGVEVPPATTSLLELRSREVPALLDEVMTSTDWAAFGVVGFTSTFQQNVASFALARRLKDTFPHLVMVFGGANFEGDMGREWVRSMDV